MLSDSKLFAKAKSPQRVVEKTRLLESLHFGANTIPVFERHNDSLQRLFRYYSSYGEPLNQQTLKTGKLLKMLKDC
jgi:hypothetical protein